MTEPRATDQPVSETVVVTAPPRRRHRAVKAVIAIVITLGVLVVAFIAVDSWARRQVADFVAEKVRTALSLDNGEPVSVDVGGTSVIAQVVTGSLEDVAVNIDEVTIGDLTGGISLRAEGVPVDASKPVDRVQIEFRVGEDGIQSLAHTLSATAIDSVRLVDGEIQVGTELSVFGVPFSVGLGVEPFADGGQIGFTPTSVELGGSRTSADSLIETFGSPARQLLQTRSLCVATWLPESLSVDEVEVRDTTLVVTIGASRAFIDEKSLSTLGTCD